MPPLVSGGWSRVPAKAEFRRLDNASGGIGFPERAGSAPLMRDLASNREAEVRSAALAPLVHFAEQNF